MNNTNAPLCKGFSHVVVNVKDLERSVTFYEAVTPLRVVARTPASMQPAMTLGIAQGQFSGALLRDPGVPLAPAVHLVQWLTPLPTGRAYPGFTNPGFFRICFQYNNAADLYRRVVAAGCAPFTEPLFGEGKRPGRPVFAMPDPDGVVLQYISLPGLERLYHVCCNCSDLAETAALFETLGMRRATSLSTTVPEKFAFGPPGDVATLEAIVFDHPDDHSPDSSPSFSIDVVQWKTPIPVGEVYPSQINLGIVRIGLIVTDLGTACATLRGRGYAVSDVELRDYGSAVGTRRTIVVRNADGAVIELFDERI